MSNFKISKTSDRKNLQKFQDKKKSPVVNEGLKNAFNLFKQFVMVGGDLV